MTNNGTDPEDGLAVSDDITGGSFTGESIVILTILDNAVAPPLSLTLNLAL
jgi:hypothetical protein